MPDDTNATPVTGSNQPQPGQVVAPGSSQPTPPTQPPVAPTPPTPTPIPPEPPAPIPPESEQVEDQEPDNDQSFDAELPEDMPATNNEVITWTASEYVEHEKDAAWYLALSATAAALTALVFLITHDKISAAVVIFGAVALGVYGARPPRQLTYQLDGSGLTIGRTRLGYETFRSFAIVPEGAFSSIVFVHHKRFAPLTTIYFAPEEEDKIVSILIKRLPFEEHKIDPIEHLMRRIRF